MITSLFPILLNLFYLQIYSQNVTNSNYTDTSNNIKLSIENLKKNSNVSICQIKKYPINKNSPQLRKPQNEPLCFKTYTNYIFHIKNGYIKYKFFNPFIKCKYQCNFPDGEKKIKTGKWKSIKNGRPNCDVFEVQCTTSLWPHILIFHDLYIQVFKQKKRKPPKVTFLKKSYKNKKIKNKYNVHLIVLDSISHYMSLRGLKNTINYLEDEYSGVSFKMHNKIGGNSQPNGHGFLLNKRISKLHNFLNLEKVKQSDYEVVGKNGCDEYLDSQPSIMKYYRQFDYTILSGEEFPDTVFSSHSCRGFKKHYAHHTTRPYILKLYNPNYSQGGKYLLTHNSKCLGYVKYQFDYLSQFMETYKGSKQFTFTWITDISHKHLTGHYQYDDYFKKYFKSNKHLFDDGFLILMSDHGFRLGDYRYTEIGSFEEKNPFLFIAPPKELRTNDSEILKNLKINSNKHTSHFDVYATMLDILTEGSRTNFTNMSYFNFTNIIKNDKIKGESLLREIDEKKRTCYSMEISSEYCLCGENFNVYNSTLVQLGTNNTNATNNDDIIVRSLKKNFVTELNNILNTTGLTNYCEMMSEKEDGEFKLQYLYTVEKKILFFIRQEVLPKGLFEAYFNEDGKIISDSIERLDRYAKYAEVCIPNHKHRMFCYCKSLNSKKFKRFSKKI